MDRLMVKSSEVTVAASKMQECIRQQAQQEHELQQPPKAPPDLRRAASPSPPRFQIETIPPPLNSPTSHIQTRLCHHDPQHRRRSAPAPPSFRTSDFDEELV